MTASPVCRRSCLRSGISLATRRSSSVVVRRCPRSGPNSRTETACGATLCAAYRYIVWFPFTSSRIGSVPMCRPPTAALPSTAPARSSWPLDAPPGTTLPARRAQFHRARAGRWPFAPTAAAYPDTRVQLGQPKRPRKRDTSRAQDVICNRLHNVLDEQPGPRLLTTPLLAARRRVPDVVCRPRFTTLRVRNDFFLQRRVRIQQTPAAR